VWITVNNDKKIKIPVSITVKIYLGLIFALIVFLSLYYILYSLGGWILLAIGIVPLVAVLFVKTEKHGVPVTKKDHPKLFEIIESVSKEIGTSEPNEVLITPSAEISVGGIFSKRLTIGIVGLRNLNLEEFKSILSHEFGHLYGKDTIVGRFLWSISYSLEKAANFGKKFWDAVPILNFAIFGIIIMLFYMLYYYIFNTVVFFYSRQLEHRADIIAIQISGKNNFYHGLLGYSTFVAFFNQTGYNSMINLLNEKKMFINIYESVYTAYEKEDIETLQKNIIRNEKISIFSSHPSIESRLKRLGKVEPRHRTKSAMVLFTDYKEIEKKMTKELTDYVNKQITIKKLYEEAKARQGKCRYCSKQFRYLKDLIEHENEHEINSKIMNSQEFLAKRRAFIIKNKDMHELYQCQECGNVMSNSISSHCEKCGKSMVKFSIDHKSSAPN
jgi:heat shock protein HtpX